MDVTLPSSFDSNELTLNLFSFEVHTMRVSCSVLSGYFGLIGLSACGGQDRSANETNSGADVEAIKAVMNEYVAGYESRNPDQFLTVFTEDAVRMQPNGSAVVGSASIRDYYEEWFQRESLDVTLAPSEIQVAGDWAFAWGGYRATVTSIADGTSRTDTGKWLNVFKRGDDGAWKFHRNIWNSDLPLPASESPAE